MNDIEHDAMKVAILIEVAHRELGRGRAQTAIIRAADAVRVALESENAALLRVALSERRKILTQAAKLSGLTN